MTRPRAAAALLLLGAGLLAGACDRRRQVASCADDLHGVWRAPTGALWMLLDNGPTLELYPLFDDSVPSGAPRVIDLHRAERGSLAGEIKRRFMVRADVCEARAPIHVTACTENALQLVLGDVSPPLAYAPCSWPQLAPTHIERWILE